MFKFLHAADVHLDSPLRGLARYPGAPAEEIRLATRKALANLVNLAIDEKVSFVLIAGDLYDGDWEDYHTGLHFVSAIAKLHEANIPLFLISGNHDAQSKMTRELRLPSTVHRFDTAKPESKRLEDIGVCIHGQGFATAAVFDDLSSNYPNRDSGAFNIGLLHTSLTGRDGHERYAPCSVQTLLSKDYDYWALGHIHLREVVEKEPLIVFPGNIQGRHIREQGPKGCAIVTVDDKRRASIDWRWLDVLRWNALRIDATPSQTEDDFFENCSANFQQLLKDAEGRLLAVRVEVSGESPLHLALADRPEHWLNQIRAIATEIGQGQIWIEKLKLRTSAVRMERADMDGSIAELAQWIAEAKSTPDQLEKLRSELSALRKKLPSELQEGEDAINLVDDEAISLLLNDVQSMLTRRLLTSEGAA